VNQNEPEPSNRRASSLDKGRSLGDYGKGDSRCPYGVVLRLPSARRYAPSTGNTNKATANLSIPRYLLREVVLAIALPEDIHCGAMKAAAKGGHIVERYRNDLKSQALQLVHQL
jgi:hypothetical protein